MIELFSVCLKTGQNHSQVMMAVRSWREEEIEYVFS